MPENKVLEEFGKEAKDIEDIRENKKTGTVEIAFKNKDKLWLTPTVDIKGDELAVKLKKTYLPTSEEQGE